MKSFTLSAVIAGAALATTIVALPGAVGAGDGIPAAEVEARAFGDPVTLAAVPAPAPTIDQTTGTCARWYTITGSDRHACDNILTNGNMTLDEFRVMNPFINDNCTNLWIGYSYCILETREYTDAQKAAVVAAGELKDWATAVNGDLIYDHDGPGPKKRDDKDTLSNLVRRPDRLTPDQLAALGAALDRGADDANTIASINAAKGQPITDAEKAAIVAAGSIKDWAENFRKSIGASPEPPKDKRDDLTMSQKAAVVAAGELKDWAEGVNGPLEYDPNAHWSYKPNRTPPSGTPPKDKRQAPTGPPNPTLQKIIDIASNLLANEVIGVFSSQHQARFFCNVVPVDKLNAEGLSGGLIKQDICDAGNQPLLTPSQYQQKTIELSTDIFITQAIASVVGKENHQTLCNILDPAQLAMAGLDAGKVKQQVCAAAN
ncbi:MAG: hypothetical protein M1836_000390 [Candelina mexicana]|nr:MAG: hypothetical protein M1836_000390 [Candelina mexicana]